MTHRPPVDSDTPPDHTVLALTIESALLPDWYEAVTEVAARHCRRMMTVEKPEQYFVRVELHQEKVKAFSDDLTSRWDRFVQARKASGDWSEKS